MQHKLIMETWRGFVSEPKKPYLIYERRGQLHRVDFDNLLKQLDEGKVSHSEAFLIYERAFEYGERRLIEEGLFDIIASGYEKGKEVFGKLTDKVKAAIKKANDFYLDMVLKGINLAQRGAAAFAKYFSKIVQAIGRFEEKHPVLFKLIMATMFAVLVYSIFGSSNAQAAVKVGSYQLDDQTYQAMQGALNSAGRDPDLAMAVGKAQVALERAHESKQAVNIETLGPIVDEALNQVVNVMGKIKQDDPGALELFSKWIDVGKSLRFKATGF